VSTDLISIKTRQLFREYFVGTTLRFISDEFDAARVDCDSAYQPPVSGARRSLVEQYYHSVNWTDWRDVKKVLQVFESILHTAENVIQNAGADSEFSKRLKAEMENMLYYLRKDGFQYVDGRIVSGAGMPSLDGIKENAAEFDAKHLAEQIRRIEQSIESDPPLAIGTAKELIETTCKTILAERGKPVSGTPDIPTLTKETLKELKLVPDSVPDSARGSDVIKRLLNNLGTIGNGLAELRGLYGTGHGKHGQTSGLNARHAKLAVGAAATLTTFLFETHKETKS
jgi:Abortive infection C-terminus